MSPSKIMKDTLINVPPCPNLLKRKMGYGGSMTEKSLPELKVGRNSLLNSRGTE
jgi:hypothetical protein